METFHRPVLLNEIIKILNLRPGKNVIDATCGAGGHTREIIKKILPGGKVLAIDWDKEMLMKARENLRDYKNVVIFKQGNYKNIKNIVNSDSTLKKIKWDAILFDFGFSMDHIKTSGRGFSFLQDEPLDMRYSLDSDLTAAKILNQYSKDDLIKIFFKYGEEAKSYKIAETIVKCRKKRKIETTEQLNKIISKVYPRRYSRINPGTKVYQALRIEVNDELENIKNGLSNGFDVLNDGGILAAISFQSLEDRIVKNFFKEKQKLNQGRIITKKPVRSKNEEIQNTTQSRSAKMRVIEKTLNTSFPQDDS